MSMRLGLDRLRKKSSPDTFETKLMFECYEPLQAAIGQFKSELGTGRLDSKLALLAIPNDVLAAITLLCVFHAVCNSQRDLDVRSRQTEATMRHCAMLIGRRCMEECQPGCAEAFQIIEKCRDEQVALPVFPANSPFSVLLAAFRERQENTRNTVTRCTAGVKTLADKDWWDLSRQLTIGCSLIEVALESIPLFVDNQVQLNEHDWDKRTRVIRLSRKGEQWLEQALNSRIEAAQSDGSLTIPMNQPMLCTPLPWSSVDNGGYVSTRANLIKSNGLNFTSTDSDSLKMVASRFEPSRLESHLQAVNSLQETSWKINRRLYDTFVRVWSDRAMRPQLFRPKSGRAPRYEFLAAVKTRIEAVEDLLPYRFYFPFQVDFRGRVYAVPELINNQSDDFTRSLLEFGSAAPVNDESEYWLSIHLANTFGQDKLTFEGRRKWVEENASLIHKFVQQPERELEFWLQADKKWNFLAAAYAWTSVMNGAKETCHPVFVDGRCNGLQHLCALSRDALAGEQVNVIGAHPNDIYGAVAEVMKKMLDHDEDPMAVYWKEVGIDRKLVKKPIMTTPYGVTDSGMRDQIKDVANERNAHPKYEHLRYIVACLKRALKETMPGPEKVKEWLTRTAKEISSSGHPIIWTAPSGFPVIQNYRMPKILRTRSRRFSFNYFRPVTESSTINHSKNAAAIVPNFVHSLDAAHLVAVVNSLVEAGSNHIAVIHDSFGVHPHMVPVMNRIIRERFVEQYSEPVLDNFREEVEALTKLSLPAFTEYGQLEMKQVLSSTYFFS
ncbi:MAG: hypothetical protein HY986_13920 [Candidatus Melainabacteria bacterium]|nr:hypothetical protein [Candidatus Melainabacteria bacterium]